jgi:hypothetical protein
LNSNYVVFKGDHPLEFYRKSFAIKEVNLSPQEAFLCIEDFIFMAGKINVQHHKKHTFIQMITTCSIRPKTQNIGSLEMGRIKKEFNQPNLNK